MSASRAGSRASAIAGGPSEQARERNLSGWVRNRRDGSVEALFAGTAEQVNAMIAACEEGPLGARVSAVHRTPADPPGEHGFHQLPTV